MSPVVGCEVRARWLGQWVESWRWTNSQHSKNCASLSSCWKPKSQEGNKSFVPKPRDRQCFECFFGIPYVYFTYSYLGPILVNILHRGFLLKKFQRSFSISYFFLNFLSLMRCSCDWNKWKSGSSKSDKYKECGWTSHPHDLISCWVSWVAVVLNEEELIDLLRINLSTFFFLLLIIHISMFSPELGNFFIQ